MTDEKTRLRYVRCIRAMVSEDAALQLAEAYERELDERREIDSPELTELEQLPSWDFPELLRWALNRPIPAAFEDSSGLLVMREFRLIGDLARAAEQAAAKGEHVHAGRIERVLAWTWLRVRGEQLLSQAFEAERGPENVNGEWDA